MKKTSILAFLMIVMGFMAQAQTRPTITTYPPVIFDGMDSVYIHYNPFGSGGDGGDTTFQTYTRGLYAYIYCNVSGSGVSGSYGNGSWASVVQAADSFVKVSDTDYVLVIPNVRQFFGILSKDIYINGFNVIPKCAGTGSSDTQGANIYIPVSHSYGAPGEAVTTGPLTYPTGGPLLADSFENFVVYYHPQYDTNRANPANGKGDSTLALYNGTIYVYSYVITAPSSVTDQLDTWGSVATTPRDSTVEIDSNNYAWAVTNFRQEFMNGNQPLASGTSVDTLAVIFRNAAGDTQTVNLYIPLVRNTTGIVNVNANNSKLSLYPNPATTAVLVSYSFAQEANTTINITNLMGQTVMTNELGQKKEGNVYLSVDNIPSGVYLVTVTNGDNKVVQRMVKQ